MVKGQEYTDNCWSLLPQKQSLGSDGRKHRRSRGVGNEDKGGT